MTFPKSAVPIGDRLLAIAKSDPQRILLVTHKGDRITYDEAAKTSLRLALGLYNSGIRAGDRFIIQLPNWPSFIYFHLALSLIGAVTVNLPIVYREKELREVLKLTQARGLVQPRQYGRDDFTSIASNLANGVENLDHLFLVGGDESLNPQGTVSFETFMREAWEDRINQDILTQLAPKLDDLTVLSFTSGTTGALKGVMLTTRILHEWNKGLAERFQLNESDVILAGSPLGHAVGFGHCLRMALSLGCSMVLMEKWSADIAVKLAAKEKCTFIAGATPFLMDMVYHQEIASGNNSLPALRLFICGGATVPEQLMRDAENNLPNTFVTPLWGMTECGGVTSCLADSPKEKFTSSDGLPCGGMELKVVDESGNTLNPGEEGELLARGPMLAQGYYQQEELTSEVFLKNGYFRTGDLARIDEDGYVKITGRIKDIVIRGGVNISPTEIENILFTHPKISNVAIIGMPDQRLGERVCAFIVLSNGDELVSMSEIQTWMSDMGVAKPKWPERLMIVDSLPMTPSGKVQKFKLTEMILSENPG